MNILWAGGEDIDFATLGGMVVDATAGHFRSGWSRCSIGINSGPGGGSLVGARTYPFAIGALTSAWLSFQLSFNGNVLNSYMWAAFGLSGTNLALGVGANSSGQICLCSCNGSTFTVLASSSLAIYSNYFGKIDFQLTNYGASSTVNIYAGGTLALSYSGSTAVSGMSAFDSVFLGAGAGGSPSRPSMSEIIVADSDTRAILGLNTLALTGAGTTTGWSNNTYSNINGVSASDNSPAYDNSNGVDQEYTVGTAQPSVFSVVAVVQSARMACPAGSTPAHVMLGYGSGGVGYFGTGAQKAPSVGFSFFQQIDQTNPITTAAWAQTDITAPLQLDLHTAA